MMYLVAVLFPPLYFLIQKKWLASIVTSFLFFLSIMFCMMIVLIPGAIILWALCAVVAIWDVRKSLMREYATIVADKIGETMIIANKVTETMRQQQQSSPRESAVSPPSSRTQFFYSDAQAQPKGPFNIDELLVLERTGILKPETYVIIEGASEWSTWSSTKSKEGKN